MARSFFTVHGDESSITVIASDEAEAVDIAVQYWADFFGDPEAYRATPSPRVGLRWVYYPSEVDRDEEVSRLERAGADMARVTVRNESDGLGKHLGWSIGASDADWCKLAPGILCGGGE